MTSQAPHPRAARTAYQARRPLLLILEDDRSARDLLIELGGEAGWEVRSAGTITAMRRALDERRPDLLIIDDDVADGRGGDVARDVRARHRTRDLRMMILTAAPPKRRAELATLGSVVPKPFDLADIERRLARDDGLERARPHAS
jgi:DNA-binding response OmpR family regulator